MRQEREPERKSARLEKKRKVPTPSVSPRRGELFADVEIEDSVLVTPLGETSSIPRSGSTDLNPDRQDPEPEGEATGSEEEAMTRLKYKTFKGDGHQDVDDWFSEFESTAIANQEEDEAKQRIFQGLLKGEALKWYQDIPVRDWNDWERLTTTFLQAFREVGGEARALGRLSKMTMRTSESVRKYGQRVKALIQKLTMEIAPSVQVEWYVAGFPEAMGFQIRQTRPANLREAMEAAHNYENSAQSLRKAVRRSEKKDKGKGKKDDRKDRRRWKYSDSDSNSESSDSEDSDSASSGSEEERSPSPPRRSHRSKGTREKTIVKVKTEDPEQRRMMKNIEDTLEAIKVNLAENRKPRRTIPTSRMNVWCARCGDPGHYASECQRPTPKRIHYVNPEEEVFYAQPEEEEEEASAIYHVQPTYGRGKAPQLPNRPNVMTNRNYQVGPSQGTNFNNPVRFSNYGDRQLGCCFICGDPNHYANTCPQRGPGQEAPLILPCRNYQEYGHQEGQCPKSVQPRPVYK
jgi:hypothetical protein